MAGVMAVSSMHEKMNQGTCEDYEERQDGYQMGIVPDHQITTGEHGETQYNPSSVDREATEHALNSALTNDVISRFRCRKSLISVNSQIFAVRSRSALPATLTELGAIAAAAVLSRYFRGLPMNLVRQPAEQN